MSEQHLLNRQLCTHIKERLIVYQSDADLISLTPNTMYESKELNELLSTFSSMKVAIHVSYMYHTCTCTVKRLVVVYLSRLDQKPQ